MIATFCCSKKYVYFAILCLLFDCIVPYCNESICFHNLLLKHSDVLLAVASISSFKEVYYYGFFFFFAQWDKHQTNVGVCSIRVFKHVVFIKLQV